MKKRGREREREKIRASCVSDARLRPLSRRALTGGTYKHRLYPVKGIVRVCVLVVVGGEDYSEFLICINPGRPSTPCEERRGGCAGG